jgi:hypothetical protein
MSEPLTEDGSVVGPTESKADAHRSKSTARRFTRDMNAMRARAQPTRHMNRTLIR